jgi:tetratricopeptide (TPR) repeat protein
MRDVLAGMLLALFAAAPPGAQQNPSAARLIEQGRWKQAQAVLDRQVKSNPNDARLLHLLSKVKVAFGNADAAVELANRAVSLDSANPDFHYQLAQAYREKSRRAGTMERVGALFSAKAEVEKTLQLAPTHVQALFSSMMFYLNAPGWLGGDEQRARAIAAEILRLNRVQGHLAQAYLAEEADDWPAVEAAYRRALEADPRSELVHLVLMRLYISPHRAAPDLAEKHAREAIAADPDRAEPYAVLAGIYAGQQRKADLEATLALAERRVPDNFEPHYRAAAILVTRGELEAAERYFRKYLTLPPEPTAPSTAEGHLGLGLVLEKRGRKADAKSEVEAALRLDPGLEEAKKCLARLR